MPRSAVGKAALVAGFIALLAAAGVVAGARLFEGDDSGEGVAANGGASAVPSEPAAGTSGRCAYRPEVGRPPVRWRGVGALGWVVYAAGRGQADLYVSRGDGSAARRLTSDPRDEYSPSWAPDATRVVFRVEAKEEGTDADIWVVNTDGNRRRNLTRTPRQAEWSPAWSPDGRMIAYFSAKLEGGDIYVMRPDGSAKRDVTQSDGPRANEYPTWSPDGEWIAYISYGREGNFEIWRIKVDGSCRSNLTARPEADTWPSWSPDGRRIAFVSDRSGARELYTMRPDGSDLRRLTSTPGANENYPSWTADGQISFVRERGDLLEADWWIVRPDGSSPRRLRGPGVLFTQMSWTASLSP